MEKPLVKRASFFKVMIGDFKTSLRIPPSFTKHLRGKLGTKSVLTSPSGRKWSVEVGRASNYFSFQSGWEAFVGDHSIVDGDFLVFLYDGDLGFDVQIYGKNGCEKEPSEAFIDRHPVAPIKRSAAGRWNRGMLEVVRPWSAVGRGRALAAARSLKPSHPHFVATYGKCRFNHMVVPRALVDEYMLSEKKSVILQDPAGTSWNVRVTPRKDGRVELRNGWSNFRKANYLREGDVCVFEFFQGGNIINVHILRVKEDTTEPARKPGSCDVGTPVQSKEGPPTKVGEERVLEAATSFKTLHPHFVHLSRSSRLYHVTIPRALVRELDLKNKQQLTLCDPCGRSWPVEVAERSNGNIDIGIGWHGFSKGNRLGEGDACVFEFVGADIIQVHIFRVEETLSITSSHIQDQACHHNLPSVPA